MDFLDAFVGQGDTAALLIENIVIVGELSGNFGKLVICVGVVAGRSGNNERSASFVDED